ncbi:MAG: thiamine diphosphokinase [Rectinemataceae bacterium]
MRALIVTGGEAPPPAYIRQLAAHCALVVAADSGLDLCRKAGIIPDFAVGDFDSLTDATALGVLPPERIFRYPADKDYTDTELALNLAFEQGATERIIAGGGGGRIDHLLALRALFERNDPPAAWYIADAAILYLSGGSTLRWRAAPGAMVSVFPLAPGARDMNSRGLAWPLDGLEWTPGAFGISNRMEGKEAEIVTRAFPLLVVLPLDAEILLWPIRQCENSSALHQTGF